MKEYLRILLTLILTFAVFSIPMLDPDFMYYTRSTCENGNLHSNLGKIIIMILTFIIVKSVFDFMSKIANWMIP